jgi:prepilin-type N-terminal cleavage/methylation domain-containing protein
MRRSVRMLDLTYQTARLHCPCVEEDTNCGLRGVSSGFTIVEIIIVVVIIAIAALAAVPMMSSASSIQIRSAANMIAADLEYAKNMAISRGENFSVVFDEGADSYKIVDPLGNVIQHPVKKGFPYEVNFQNESRLNKVDITNANFNTTAQTVTFNCLSSPIDGGAVILQADGTTKTITVEPITGFISIQ